jgi:hypothetical protein
MNLRLDHLLTALRERAAGILEAIDRDPLLLKRESGGLILANASQELYTPQHEHQLYAKGIVYRRSPYQLVSLPLIKIYNLGERDVSVADLTELAAEPDVRLHFLRKIDGSLVQVFRAEGQVWFSTRGMIEGGRLASCERTEGRPEFDYVGTARRIAHKRYPRLLDQPALLEGLTLVFELIHPEARNVTSYGERSDLILLAGFDRHQHRYLTYAELVSLANTHALEIVDALSPRGPGLSAQIDDLLASLAGTDQEGSVLTFERRGQVVYRVKVKSPNYLHLMRVLSECTYERTVEIVDANPAVTSWAELEALLRARGREEVPEEVLGYYRPHFERFMSYRADCERVRQWAAETCQKLEDRLGGRQGAVASAYRKTFAALANHFPLTGLIFAAFDGRLDLDRVRNYVRTVEEAGKALARIAAFKTPHS